MFTRLMTAIRPLALAFGLGAAIMSRVNMGSPVLDGF